MEERKNKRVVTGVTLLLMIYITSWLCFTGDDVRILLYGGYAIVCGLTFLKLMFSGYGTSLFLPKPAERLFLFSIFFELQIVLLVMFLLPLYILHQMLLTH